MTVPNTHPAMTIDRCLRGEKLYGDDFSQFQVEAWFKDEENAYFNLGAKNATTYIYPYHALNWMHGFSVLPSRTYRRVLGIGGAFGDELAPVVGQSEKITILESSEGFKVPTIRGVPVDYVKPKPSGMLPFADAEFDLISCLSVLHHIPNVSALIEEIFRCARPGGYVLFREPIVSMGDWRRPRVGLTSHERGIPLKLFRRMILTTGLEIIRERKCVFPLTRRFQRFSKSPIFNSRLWTKFDSMISNLPFWSDCYHPESFLQKLRPQAVFFVVRRPV